MKSILTNARQEDLEFFIGRAGQNVGQGQANASGSAAQDADDNTRGLDDEPNEDDETLIIPTKSPESETCLWVIKLPRYLLERWSAVDEDGRQLGTLRVWNMRNPENDLPYMTIYTPSEEDPKVMEEFDITVLGEAVKNRYVFAAQADNDSPGAPRARCKVLVGKVTSRATAQPTYDDAYSKRMHDRYEAAQPRRHIEMIDFREGVRLMTRDVSKGDIINTAINKSKLAKNPGNRDPKDKFTRMLRDELVKLLSVVFGENLLWGIKELRIRTEQPLAYLQQVLPEIAEKVEKGATKGKWKLTSGYRDALNTLPEEGGSQNNNATKGDLDDDENDDEDDSEDDNEDDSDMEEIG